MNSEYPIKKTYTVTVEYWDCGNPDHRHKTEHVALECALKRQQPKIKPKKWDEAKYREVVAMRDSGATFREIGEKYELSQVRAREVFNKAERYLRWIASKPKQPSGDIKTLCLETRATYALMSSGVFTVDDLLSKSLNDLREMPDIGETAIINIRKALKDAGIDCELTRDI